MLVATASGLIIAIPAFGAFYFLRNRAAASLHKIQDIINSLFRKMPYESLAGVHLGDDELYAAIPNWLAPDAPADRRAEPASAGLNRGKLRWREEEVAARGRT